MYKSGADIVGYLYNLGIEDKLNITEVYKKRSYIRNEEKFTNLDEWKTLCNENGIESESVIAAFYFVWFWMDDIGLPLDENSLKRKLLEQ